ncbi:MAG: hypothetical protein AB7F40_11890 [Victivallaceae bacterium]|nr:hypothetical protein [Victivallaceae bacterium]
MKSESPITLFSFQDIITCLTGIMIVVILVIILQILQASAATMAEAVSEEHMATAKAEAAKLEADREKLQEELRVLNESAAVDPGKLEEAIGIESKYNRVLQARAAELERRIADLRSELDRQQKTRQIACEAASNAAEDEQRSIEATENNISGMKREASDIKTEISKKRRTVAFAFPGSIQKTPIIVECNERSFRVSVYKSGDIRAFGDDKTLIDQSTAQLLQWLDGYDFNKFFLVILIKEGAMSMINDLETKIRAAHPEAQMSRELILDDEECFE